MIGVTDLRPGTTFQEANDIFVVLSYEHIKMGRGSANIKVKVRNVRSGSSFERSFINGAMVQPALLEKKEYQFLYKDTESAYFMEPSSYEQINLPLDRLEGYAYLKEGDTATIQFFDEEPIMLVLPPKVTMKVVDTAPGVRGDSASNVTKDAKLENGMSVKVPLFINIGDSVIIDTREGNYTKRA